MHSFTIYKKRNFYPTMKTRLEGSESSLRPSTNFFKNDSIGLPEEDHKLGYSSNLEPLPPFKETRLPAIEEQTRTVLFEGCPSLPSGGSFSLVLSQPFYLDWECPGRDLVKCVIHNKNLVVYDKNQEDQAYACIHVPEQHELRMKEVNVSFLSQTRFNKFMVVVFSISSITGKIQQHSKTIVTTTKTDPSFYERIDLRNEVLNTGEYNVYVGIMSKNNIKGMLNVSIHSLLNKERSKQPVDSFQKHFKKLM